MTAPSGRGDTPDGDTRSTMPGGAAADATITGVTPGQLLAVLTERFAAAGISSARSDARWLLLHALDWTAGRLTLSRDVPVTAAQLAAVAQLADRRAAREPLQLVLGGTDFRGHALQMRRGVFIPRPETELLVDLVRDALPAGGLVVETCAGSGAIACAVAAERPDARVVAIDRDRAAVDLTRDNADHLGVTIEVLHGDLLAPLPADLHGAVDVLVANPPYLAAGEVEALEPEVRDWDPPAALVAGPTGHEVSDLLFAAAGRHLRPGGRLLLELDERRVPAAAARACAAGLVDVATHADLTGRPRFVSARRPDAPSTARSASGR